MTLVHVIRLHEGYISSVCRQRPYHVERTGSRPITEVKQRRSRLVLGWVTAWEHRVLLVSVFYLFVVVFVSDVSPSVQTARPCDFFQVFLFCFLFRFSFCLFLKKEKKKRRRKRANSPVSFSTGDNNNNMTDNTEQQQPKKEEEKKTRKNKTKKTVCKGRVKHTVA